LPADNVLASWSPDAVSTKCAHGGDDDGLHIAYSHRPNFGCSILQLYDNTEIQVRGMQLSKSVNAYLNKCFILTAALFMFGLHN
jgi:hypothetical protein